MLFKNFEGKSKKKSPKKKIISGSSELRPFMFALGFFLNVHKYNAGIARGCGWQKIGAYVNLGSYYIVGIPSAVLLAFVLHIGGRVKLIIMMMIFTHMSCNYYSP